MNTKPTIPCPVCEAPVQVQYLRSSSGNATRLYTDPLLSDDEVIAIHRHQYDDVDDRIVH